jgi:hypothetical protein
MNPRRVVIVGNQLFANALRYLLSENDGIDLVDCVSSLQDCVQVMEHQTVDTLIIAESLMPGDYPLCDLLKNYPDKTIVKAHLETNQLEVITQQHIQARPQELLAMLSSLPGLSD